MSRSGFGKGKRTADSKKVDTLDKNSQIVEHKFFIKDFICQPMKIYRDKIADSTPLDVLESCDKVIMSQASLEHLSKFTTADPITMKIYNKDRYMYVGVRDFTADHQRVYTPQWIMDFLKVAESGRVTLKSVELPKATYIKFEPLSPLFKKLQNPRIVLEINLQNFTTLCLNEIISIRYCGITFQIKIVELQPSEAVHLNNADVKIDIQTD
jgi:ubiquitin fusion degradation protein 1